MITLNKSERIAANCALAMCECGFVYLMFKHPDQPLWPILMAVSLVFYKIAVAELGEPYLSAQKARAERDKARQEWLEARST